MRLIVLSLTGFMALSSVATHAIEDAPQQTIPFSHLMANGAATLDLSTQAKLSPEQATRYHQLIEQYRCPKCQNANLAGSDAPIAQDLKHKILLMVAADQSDGEIRDYLVSRYGEFISYQPVVKPATWLLWFLPPLILVLGLLGWLLRSRRHGAVTLPLDIEEQERLKRLLGQQEQGHDR